VTPTSPPIGSPVAVDLLTDDLDSARRFYGPLLGWTFGFDESLQIVRCLAAGIPTATLCPSSSAPVAGWRVTFAGPAPAVTAERAARAGGRLLSHTGSAPSPLHVADPAGATFAVTGDSMDALPGPAPGRPAWFENMTADAPAADRFYQDVLELVPVAAQDTHQQPPGPDYVLLTAAGRPVAGRLALTPDLAATLGSRWMVYFAHSDVDSAATRAGELGGGVLVPPRDTPTGRVAAVADPAGAVFTLLRP
jgi:predicted enzyme related to lactoylglutathione lyase